jgi:hypothetical protein
VVEVEHAHREIANVTVRCAVYVEYLHLVRTREGWRIITVNALRLRGRPAPPGLGAGMASSSGPSGCSHGAGQR